LKNGRASVGSTTRHQGRAEVEAVDHHGNDVSLKLEGSFDFTPNPVLRVSAAPEGRGSQHNHEVSAGADIGEDHLFEVVAGNAGVVEENVKTVMREVLEDGERPGLVCPAVAEENGVVRRILRGLQKLCENIVNELI
jgi:hypothetical protein